MSALHELAAAALRQVDPESAHRAAIVGLKAGLGLRTDGARWPRLATKLCGLELPNPIGLAAGFDKNAEVIAPMLAAGFGFVEAGTVTPQPQAGNPRPRLFRLSEDRAVINRMGFNNDGLAAFVPRLARSRAGIVGANVGANKDSADRVADYVQALEAVWPHCSYVTVNISSPNTPGLRGLQERGALEELLGRLREARACLSGVRPVFLKVAPDLDDVAVADIVALAVSNGIDALIVSNTTVARPDALRSGLRTQPGGLSGAPLFEPSTRILRLFAIALQGRLPLIGVGGIASGAEAQAKIKAGASAVQLYSALVYEGPGLVERILSDHSARLAADGFGRVSEAVGVDAK